MNHSRLVRSAVIAPAIALVLGPAPGAGGPTSGVLIHRWEQTYEASLFTGPVGIGTTRDGTRVFAAGNSGESEYISWHDYVALAYDGPTGAEIWRAFLERPPEKNLTAVAMGVSSDGARVFVTGNGPGVGPNEGKGAFTTVAFDGATGERLWVASYSGPGARNAASNLALSGDGSRVFVEGFSEDATGEYSDTVVAYRASDGRQMWVSPGFDTPGERAFAASPDGSAVYVSGTSGTPGGSADYLVTAIDGVNGSVKWRSYWDGPTHHTDVSRGLAVSGDSRYVLLTGTTPGPQFENATGTVALDSYSGEPVWSAIEYSPSGQNAPVSIGASPDGSSAFVLAANSSPFSWVTLAYDVTSGGKQWMAVRPRQKRVFPSALSVAPDGSAVWITGDDYDTIAYDQHTGRTLARLWGVTRGVEYVAAGPWGSGVYDGGGGLGTGKIKTVGWAFS